MQNLEGAATPLMLRSETAGPGRTAARAFVLALGTQISNPKAAVVYASVFAAFLPRTFPVLLGVGTVVIIFIIETGWYALVAAVLSADGPRAAYLRYKAWVDRSAGGVMGILGIRLITSARGG